MEKKQKDEIDIYFQKIKEEFKQFVNAEIDTVNLIMKNSREELENLINRINGKIGEFNTISQKNNPDDIKSNIEKICTETISSFESDINKKIEDKKKEIEDLEKKEQEDKINEFNKLLTSIKKIDSRYELEKKQYNQIHGITTTEEAESKLKEIEKNPEDWHFYENMKNAGIPVNLDDDNKDNLKNSELQDNKKDEEDEDE